MITRKLSAIAAGVAIAGSAVAMSASAAAADHTHVRHVGNGECVVLGGGGYEGYVQLPAVVADPSVYPENRRHPLHVLVHQGEPGAHGTIEVLGSDTCSAFVNG